MRPVDLVSLVLIGSSLIFGQGCASGKRWVNEPYRRTDDDHGIRIYDGRKKAGESGQSKTTARLAQPEDEDQVEPPFVEEEPQDGQRPQVTLKGRKKPKHISPPDGSLLGEFRNTYYDFPSEAAFAQQRSKTGEAASKRVDIKNPQCQAIKSVPKGFYDSVCVQGSGTLIDGRTVSFAKRDCSCAEICPRTSQKICFDVLDPSEFPWGRGARGTAITPLSTVAVDSSVIPLGTHIYIAEYDGVLRHPGGGRHNGCFVAEDRGMKVTGKHVDIFTGNPSITEHLNALIPSNLGVHVYEGTSRCQ